MAQNPRADDADDIEADAFTFGVSIDMIYTVKAYYNEKCVCVHPNTLIFDADGPGGLDPVEVQIYPDPECGCRENITCHLSWQPPVEVGSAMSVEDLMNTLFPVGPDGIRTRGHGAGKFCVDLGIKREDVCESRRRRYPSSQGGPDILAGVERSCIKEKRTFVGKFREAIRTTFPQMEWAGGGIWERMTRMGCRSMIQALGIGGFEIGGTSIVTVPTTSNPMIKRIQDANKELCQKFSLPHPSWTPFGVMKNHFNAKIIEDKRIAF